MNKNKLLFLLPSFLGVLIFLTPISWDGHYTIGISIINDWIRSLMGDYGLHIVVTLMVATSLFTLLGTVFRVAWIHRHSRLRILFDVPAIWLVLRLLGTLFGLIYLFQVGPEAEQVVLGPVEPLPALLNEGFEPSGQGLQTLDGGL